MYVILEYLTFILVVIVLAAVLFGASVLALLTKESASRIARASRKTIHVATGSLGKTSREAQTLQDPPNDSVTTS
jgi:hypothetical protein